MSSPRNSRSLVREDLVGSSTASNLAFNEKVNQMKATGSTVYHFGFGESPFPVPECLAKALQNEVNRKEYLNINGIPELREGIVNLEARENGLKISAGGIVVGPGSKQLIYLAMAVFNGVVVVPAPAWTTYGPQVRLAGRKLVIAKTAPGLEGGFKLTAQLLKKSIEGYEEKNIMLLLTNPGNPSGTCYTEEELKELSCVCREKKIIVVSDEIYASLKFDGVHHSIQKFYPEGTILSSGFSKCLSVGGWRIGYLHFPGELKEMQEAVSAGASQTYSCAPAPMQFALAKVLRENIDDITKYMTDCRNILAAVGDYCYRELKEEGVSGTKSEGGYYFMPDFGPLRQRLNRRGLYTGKQMTQSMLKEANVALMPSSYFLMPEDDLSTRFCFICFDGGHALRSLQKLRTEGATNREKSLDALGDDFVNQYCSEVVAGVKALRKWCNL